MDNVAPFNASSSGAAATLKELIAVESNHVQGNLAQASAANPVLSPTIAFTCVGPAKKVRVIAFCYPIANAGTTDDSTVLTLLLDGSAIAGVPTPKGSLFNAGPLGFPMAETLGLSWIVTFPDNAAHTLGVQVATGSSTITLGPGTIDAQEVIA